MDLKVWYIPQVFIARKRQCKDCFIKKLKVGKMPTARISVLVDLGAFKFEGLKQTLEN